MLGVGGMVLPAMALMKQHRVSHHDYDARLPQKQMEAKSRQPTFLVLSLKCLI